MRLFSVRLPECVLVSWSECIATLCTHCSVLNYSSIHACVFMKTLIGNFVKQEIAPRELVMAGSAPGMFYKASAAVASK